jgi:YidC/Oxa1 family membrane protein insertase
VPAAAAPAKGETVRVRTDLFVAEIDTLGGTLKRLELLKHKDSADPNKDFVLLGPEHHYEVQSGLAGEGGPNHRTLWRAKNLEYVLEPGKDVLEVRLSAVGRDASSTSVLVPSRHHVIDLGFEVKPGQAPVTVRVPALTHDGAGGRREYPRPVLRRTELYRFAVYSEEVRKIHFGHRQGQVDVLARADNGWSRGAALLYTAALLPEAAAEYVFEKRPDGIYVGRVLVPSRRRCGGTAQLTLPSTRARRNKAGSWPRRPVRPSSTTAGSPSLPGRCSGCWRGSTSRRQLRRGDHPDGAHQAGVLLSAASYKSMRMSSSHRADQDSRDVR